MSNTPSDGKRLTVHVSVTGLDPQQASAMALTVAAQGIDDALRDAGYETRGVYTGSKGASEFEIIKEIAQTLYANKDLIIALAGLATPIVSHLLKKREEKKQKAVPNPTITFIVASAQKSIEVSESLTEERLLAELLEIEPELPPPGTELPPLAVKVAMPTTSGRRR